MLCDQVETCVGHRHYQRSQQEARQLLETSSGSEFNIDQRKKILNLEVLSHDQLFIGCDCCRCGFDCQPCITLAQVKKAFEAAKDLLSLINEQNQEERRRVLQRLSGWATAWERHSTLRSLL